jgi:hypothetical protein
MKGKMLKLLLTAGVLGIINAGLAQTNSSAPTGSASTGPRIAFETPAFDFGKVDSGTAVKHDFTFTNLGDQTLVINDVHPGCGCTTAGAWDKQVEPGKTGKISIEFHSNGYGGPVTKTVSVTCNDPTQGSITLQLKGVVWRPFDVAPSYTVFNVSPDNQTSQTNVIRITSNLDKPVVISDPTCSRAAFNMQLKTLQEGKVYELLVVLVSPIPTSSMNAPIILKTSSTNMPVISILSYVMVQPLVSLMPNQVMLPPGPFAGEQQSTVTFQNNSTNPLVLSEPAINVTNVGVKLEEAQPGRRFNLIMTFPAGFKSQPGKNMEATVKSNNPKIPLIKIPVYQQPAPPSDAVAPAAPMTSQK